MQKSFRYWNIFVTESFGLSAGERRQLGRVLRLEIATCRTLPMTSMMTMLKADRITKYIDAEKAHNWLKQAVKRQRAKWVTCFLIFKNHSHWLSSCGYLYTSHICVRILSLLCVFIWQVAFHRLKARMHDHEDDESPDQDDDYDFGFPLPPAIVRWPVSDITGKL